SLEACLFRRVCHSECGGSPRDANQEAEGSTLYRRVVERVPVRPGRSRVRTPPAPPTIEHAILRLHSAKRIQGALLRRTNKRSWRASGLPQRQLLARIEESRSLEACLFRRLCHSEGGSSRRNTNQEAEGSTLYRRVVERVPVKPGRSRARPPPAPPF